MMILVPFLLSCLTSCNDPDQRPVGELCLIGNQGCVCNDPRKTPPNYVISFDECLNFIATNPYDYQRLMDFISDLQEELMFCEL